MTLLLTAALLLSPVPVEECPPGLIHYMPYCLSAEQLADWGKPPPPAPPSPFGVERWRPMVEHFWDEPHTSRMLRIMKCESGGDPRAYNPRSGVKGLFQVHPLWQKPWPGDYYDPWTNAAVAYQVWLEQGYRAWACKA